MQRRSLASTTEQQRYRTSGSYARDSTSHQRARAALCNRDIDNQAFECPYSPVGVDADNQRRRGLKRKPRHNNLNSTLSPCSTKEDLGEENDPKPSLISSTQAPHCGDKQEVTMMDSPIQSPKRKRCDSGFAEGVTSDCTALQVEYDTLMGPLVWEYPFSESAPSLQRCNSLHLDTQSTARRSQPATADNTDSQKMMDWSRSPATAYGALSDSGSTDSNDSNDLTTTPGTIVSGTSDGDWSTPSENPDERLIDFDGLADLCQLSCQNTVFTSVERRTTGKHESSKDAEFGDTIDPSLHFWEFGRWSVVTIGVLQGS